MLMSTTNCFLRSNIRANSFFQNTQKRFISNRYKKVNMLSIDGGGIRGIIPAMRLVFMEQLLSKKLNNPDFKLGEIFDFIAGTSTGSILSLGLTKPSVLDKTKLEYSASDLFEFYLNSENQRQIFTPTDSYKNGILSRTGIKFDTQYKNQALEKLLQEKFDDIKLSDAIISDDLIITSYNISINKPRLFTKSHAKKYNKLYKMWEIALASSAAPTYFDAAKIANQFYIDGGMVANNPTMAMVGVALSRYRKDQLFCVSLGAGNFTGDVYPKTGGDLAWARSALSITIDGTSEINHQLAKHVFLPAKYHRFQVKLKENLPLDAIKNSEIKKLLEYAALTPKEEKKLDFICEEIAKRYLYNKGIAGHDLDECMQDTLKFSI